MNELHVRRWRCNGHDRLYVQTELGQRLGYYDLTTNSARVRDDALIPTVLRAAGAYLWSSHTGSGGPRRTRIEPDPVLWQVIEPDEECKKKTRRRLATRLRSLINGGQAASGEPW